MDDLPVIFGLLQQMRIQAIIDKVVIPHGNWQGLSPGWVITIWLMHILSECQHIMEPVQAWVGRHQHVLRQLTGQAVCELDFTDDRLARCLFYLHERETWTAIEAQLSATLMRVYDLNQHKVVRLDATVGSVAHDPTQHTLFQVGKAKQGQYETQFKMMLASLDPLGLVLVADVVAGDRADDPLYVPCYRRMKQTIKQQGLLIVGDCKMSASETRAVIVQGGDYYLSPLAFLKAEPSLLDDLLQPWQGREEEATRIFLPEDIPSDGCAPDPDLAIAYGFEVSRPRTAIVAGKTVNWTERLLVIRSLSYQETIQDGLHRRLDKAEAALRALTPARQRGKRQFIDQASLKSAIKQIETKYRVEGLFHTTCKCQVQERHIRGYKGNPSRVERKVRYQLTVTRNQEAIAEAEFKAGWRIYVTNAPPQELDLSQSVLTYRDQYLVENVFRRLQGHILSITPVYVQRDDHALGLFHLLTIGARLLALGDYQAQQALAQENTELTGIYRGNPKRGTTRPTTERMLKAFENINLLIIPSEARIRCYLTQLSSVQERILTLLGLPRSLYTDLQVG
ncbi:MAG: transposase [Anaerolineae bacterium]|nr:transposase [Anaerolineae bacterium]